MKYSSSALPPFMENEPEAVATVLTVIVKALALLIVLTLYAPWIVTPLPVVDFGNTTVAGRDVMPWAVRATDTVAFVFVVVKTGTAPPLLTVDVALVPAV